MENRNWGSARERNGCLKLEKAPSPEEKIMKTSCAKRNLMPQQRQTEKSLGCLADNTAGTKFHFRSEITSNSIYIPITECNV
ncbi:hypothetical protein EAG_04711 [Camponotus floridanus]|uniref:Uncharacterized protein n=1 Tax=Camponotus floridanus TaxID=104421 RepID=E2AIQ0_CAMFO|nr:hypothetical protein EAG_04711 [Camponotus floridanus]